MIGSGTPTPSSILATLEWHSNLARHEDHMVLPGWSATARGCWWKRTTLWPPMMSG